MSHKHERGAILLTLLLGMVFLAAAGAAMAPMLSTSVEDQAIMSQGSQAFYVAESGYSLAANRFLHAKDGDKDEALEKLHNKTFFFNKNNKNEASFTLEVFPRWLTVQSSAGTTVTAQISGGVDSEFIDSAQTFYCPQTGRRYTGQLHHSGGHRSLSQSRNTHLFTISLDSSEHGLHLGSALLPAARPESSVITKNANLHLSTDAQAFPKYGGVFRVQGLDGAWTYTKREDNTLYNIRSSTAPTASFEPIPIPEDAYVFLDKFVTVKSTGRTRYGNYALSYAVPIGWTYESTEAPKEVVLYEDFKEDAGGFSGNTKPNPITGGNSGMRLQQKGTVSYTPRSSRASYASIKRANDGCLNYDAQVKLKFNINDSQKKNIFAGLRFRLANERNGYGFSLVGGNILSNKIFFNNAPTLRELAQNWRLFYYKNFYRHLDTERARHSLYYVLWGKNNNGKRHIRASVILSAYYADWIAETTTTLAARVTEGYTANFELGALYEALTAGSTLQWASGSATLVREPVYSEGSFYPSSSYRAGKLLLRFPKGITPPTGQFQARYTTPEGASGDIYVSHCSSKKTNYIECFIATSDPLWFRYLFAYPQGKLTWPENNWLERGEIKFNLFGYYYSRIKTFFEPVQLTLIAPPSTLILAKSYQQYTVFDCPDYISPDTPRQEVGVHDDCNFDFFDSQQVHFHDFAIRALSAGTQATGSFTAPIVISQ